MDSLESEIDRIVDFLKPYLPLTNSHTVDFIVNNAWERVIPENIRNEVESDGLEEVLHRFWNRTDRSALSIFLDDAKNYEVERTDFCIAKEELENLNKGMNKKTAKVNEFMSDKKLHEVEIMSGFVADVASVSNSSLILDIGSGKGYLTSVLALQYGLKILGIDNKQVNITGATKTTMKLEKKWKIYEKLAQPDLTPIPKPPAFKEPCSNHDEYYNKYKWRSAIIGDLYKQRVESISKNTNIQSILNEEYPDEYHENVLLVGLHTCGNLASSSLELFVNNSDRIKSIVNIGCCYHLVEEKFAENPCWKEQQFVKDCEYGFPMSTRLTNRKFSLGRDARMCGTQKPLDVFQESEITNATKPLFYRALLQKYMQERFPNNFPRGVIGRLAHKCKTFSEYGLKALKKLGVSEQLSEDDLESFEKVNVIHWERLKIFFLLKTALSPVIEAIILLDRLLYLYEKNMKNSFIARLFDPSISPRCYGIVALPTNYCDFNYQRYLACGKL